MPPQWMWPLDHELERWFDELKRTREAESGRDRPSNGPQDDDEGLDHNDLIPAIARGRR